MLVACPRFYLLTCLSTEPLQTRVYENMKVLPRAWLAPAVRILSAAQILSTIQTSRLPDGSLFEPRRMALVEEPMLLPPGQESTADVSVEVEDPDATTVVVRTRSTVPSLLVLSDVFYPGWRATVDGGPVRILRTDYVLRGVLVPSGQHVIQFEYRPASLTGGALISVLTLVLFVVLFLGRKRPPSAV